MVRVRRAPVPRPGPGTLGGLAGGAVVVERIAFVGLGTMGAAMAANLRRAGFEVTVWNRTPGRAGELLALGAREAATPAEAARAADVVVSCVSDTPDVEAVLFGADGVADGPRRRRPRDRLLDDLAVGDRGASPTRLARAGDRLRGRARVGRLRGRQARRRSRSSWAATPADAERARPVLAAMGKTITHFGPAGSGQAVKAVNQVVIAGRLPRRRRGHGPRDEGGPGPDGGRRGAGRRRGQELDPREPQRRR